MPVRSIHAIAGALALAVILIFQAATVWSEIAQDPAAIRVVKATILYALPVLVLFMATTGASGARLGRGWKLQVVATKRRRMLTAAVNGVLVLVPLAALLHMKAQATEFDSMFWFAQAAELAAGLVNVTLLAMNMRDGLRLRARRAIPRPSSTGAAA